MATAMMHRGFKAMHSSKKKQAAAATSDILAGLWVRYVVPSDALLKFADYLKDFTGGGDDVSLS